MTTKIVGPVILTCALVLGGCSTTSGTAVLEGASTQESADAPAADAAAVDPPEAELIDDMDPAVPGETFGTRDAPLSIDTEVDLGEGWTISVSDTNLDAWSEIEEIDSYMDEPEPGRVFVSARLSMAFSGDGGEDPGFDLSYTFIGAKGNTFTDSDNCAPYDVALWSVGDMYAGATAEAVMCVSVPEDQADGGVWRIQHLSMDSFETVEAYYSTS